MILAIDQGTTGTTCFVFDERAEPIGRAYREFAQHFPQPGWVEHDAARDLGGHAGRRAARRSPTPACVPASCAAVGIANQRETVCVVGPATRRAAAPRDRLAGPPHGRALRGAARRRARAARARAHRPRARPLLLGDEDRVAARATSPACASGRATGAPCSGRSTPGWSSSSPASTSPTPPTRRARCSTTSPPDAGTRSCSTCSTSPRRALPSVRAERRRVRRDAARRRCTATPSRRGRRRRPAGGAVRPGLRRSGHGQEHLRHRLVRAAQHGLHRRPSARARAARRPSPGASAAADDLRAGGVDLRHRRRRAVAARRAAASSSAPPRPRRWPPRSTPTTASTSCPRSPASARRTGIPTRAGRSSGSRAAPAARTWRARRSRRSPTRRSTRCARWRQLRDGRSSELRADGGATANGWLMQFQADVLGVPVVLCARSPRRPRWAPPTWRASASALWTVSDVAALRRERGALRAAHGRGRARASAGRLGRTRWRARA